MPTHLNYKDKSKNVNVTKRLEAVRSRKWSGRERVMHATMMMKMRNTENTEETQSLFQFLAGTTPKNLTTGYWLLTTGYWLLTSDD